jgi:hypothetical protein
MPNEELLRWLGLATLALVLAAAAAAVLRRGVTRPSLAIETTLGEYRRTQTLTVALRNRRRAPVEVRAAYLMLGRRERMALRPLLPGLTPLPIELPRDETFYLHYPLELVALELSHQAEQPLRGIACQLAPDRWAHARLPPEVAGELRRRARGLRRAARPGDRPGPADRHRESGRAAPQLTLGELAAEIETMTSASTARAVVSRASRVAGVQQEVQQGGPLEVRELLRVCQALAAEGGTVQQIAEVIAARALEDRG